MERESVCQFGQGVVAEDVKILKPVAVCLDTQHVVLGYGVHGYPTPPPHLRLLKNQVGSLNMDDTIISCKHLVEYLRPTTPTTVRPGAGTSSPSTAGCATCLCMRTS